jgi:hypothetical protein
MLKLLTPTPPPIVRQAQPPPAPISIITISAANIVKARRPARERAHLAARWIFGRTVIEARTATMAAGIFDVSAPSVYRAVAEFSDAAANDSDRLHYYWSRASSGERADFVRANLLPIWDQVEHIITR